MTTAHDRSLLLLCGSLRTQSYNRQLASEAARLFGGTSQFADIRFPLYDGDLETAEGIPAAVSHVAAQIAAADAVVIATPEYNQSLSGVLKNALDWISRVPEKPWKDKPVAIVSAAAGRAGGARAQYALRLALTPFQPTLLTGPEVMVAGAAEVFDDRGRLGMASYEKALAELMEKLRRAAGPPSGQG